MILIVLIYLLGSVCTYFRWLATMYEIDEEFLDYNYPSYTDSLLQGIMICSTSWIGFLSGTIMYFFGEDKYFWKWSKKKLQKRYKRLHKIIERSTLTYQEKVEYDWNEYLKWKEKNQEKDPEVIL
jgi:uncharacterized protein (DUF2062 family)